MSADVITEDDVAGFRDKLDAWASTLSAGERAVLQLVLVRAFPPDVGDDVEGFDNRAKGNVQHQEFHFVKLVDKATPVLMGMAYPTYPTFTTPPHLTDEV